jgi:ankyrin repeat protein
MGTWNAKPFGNDTASDWLWELIKAKDDSVLESPLTAVLTAKKSPDADDCARAFAAASVIEAARREPPGKLPKEAKQWVKERGFVPSDAVIKQAIQTVERIARESELRDVWEESPSYAKWQKEADALAKNLRAAQKLSVPSRKPKPPSARLSLPKLIERINPNEESPLRAKLRRKLETLSDLNAPVSGTLLEEPPLHLVVQQGLIPEAKLLVTRGADINRKLGCGLTPLELSCIKGRAEMAKFLLGRGAQLHGDVFLANAVNVLPPDVLAQGPKLSQFSGALNYAVASGDVATVKVLVCYGANLLQTDLEGKTLLHIAVEALAVSGKMIQFLALAGLDIEAKNHLGETPFYRAAVMWSKTSMMKLLELGANPNARNSEGNTALDFVDRPGPAQEIAALLRQHGGRISKEI